jgi:protein Shroom
MQEQLDSVRELESQVTMAVESAADRKQLDKFRLYLTDADQVTNLLLMLAGRLARCTVDAVGERRRPPQAPSGEQNRTTSTYMTPSRRAAIIDKFNDARLLKSDIDRRRQVVSTYLSTCLSGQQYADYTRLLTEKTRVTLQQREVEDWLRITDDHIRTLREEQLLDPSAIVSHC